jgi:signal transduction histidine kinase
LVVRDYGAGIPTTDLPQIFSRFYQATRSEDRPSRRGLGLGLFIAHELVEAHGGSIEVASVEAPRAGQGTTFTIHLPLAPDGEREPRRK